MTETVVLVGVLSTVAAVFFAARWIATNYTPTNEAVQRLTKVKPILAVAESEDEKTIFVTRFDEYYATWQKHHESNKDRTKLPGESAQFYVEVGTLFWRGGGKPPKGYQGDVKEYDWFCNRLAEHHSGLIHDDVFLLQKKYGEKYIGKVRQMIVLTVKDVIVPTADLPSTAEWQSEKYHHGRRPWQTVINYYASGTPMGEPQKYGVITTTSLLDVKQGKPRKFGVVERTPDAKQAEPGVPGIVH